MNVCITVTVDGKKVCEYGACDAMPDVLPMASAVGDATAGVTLDDLLGEAKLKGMNPLLLAFLTQLATVAMEWVMEKLKEWLENRKKRRAA